MSLVSLITAARLLCQQTAFISNYSHILYSRNVYRKQAFWNNPLPRKRHRHLNDIDTSSNSVSQVDDKEDDIEEPFGCLAANLAEPKKAKWLKHLHWKSSAVVKNVNYMSDDEESEKFGKLASQGELRCATRELMSTKEAVESVKIAAIDHHLRLARFG